MRKIHEEMKELRIKVRESEKSKYVDADVDVDIDQERIILKEKIKQSKDMSP